MKINEARWDRILRVVAGIALLVVGFWATGGTIGAVIGIVGLILLATGLVGWCPLYSLLKFSTNKT